MSVPFTQGSIRRRLLLSLLAGAAVLAIGVYLVMQSVARQVAQESQDNVLTASALSILDSARSSGGLINVDLPYSALSMLDSVSEERVFYAIHLGREFLSGYADLPRADGATVGNPAFRSEDFLGEEVRIASVARPVSMDEGQQTLHVSVAQTLSGQKSTVARFSQTSLAIGAAFFLSTVVLALIVARSTTRPLHRLTESVSRRGPKDLSAVAAPVPSEMTPLVASLNTLMARLETSLSKSEDFIAEAAHRLRTPLAIVRTKAEVMLRRSDDVQTRHALHELIHAVDESSRTAGQLLDHAMVAFRLDQLANEEVDLGQLAHDTVERLRPISDIKDVELLLSSNPGMIIPGDRILLQNALHNLLDNAIKYCPPGSKVTVNVIDDGAGYKLDVCDNGAGFPAKEIADLASRFSRGTNAAGVVGSGLGLTIVKDVVEAHGGSVDFTNALGGGACVSCYFSQS